MDTIRKIVELADLFAIGGSVYGLLEIIWRGYTHWTMVLLSGSLFLLIGGVNAILPCGMPLFVRSLIGGAVITGAEFGAGCILNLFLHLSIWDYSQMPLHLMGQICLPYSAAWIALSAVAITAYAWCHRTAWSTAPLHQENKTQTPSCAAASVRVQ